MSNKRKWQWRLFDGAMVLMFLALMLAWAGALDLAQWFLFGGVGLFIVSEFLY